MLMIICPFCNNFQSYDKIYWFNRYNRCISCQEFEFYCDICKKNIKQKKGNMKIVNR